MRKQASKKRKEITGNDEDARDVVTGRTEEELELDLGESSTSAHSAAPPQKKEKQLAEVDCEVDNITDEEYFKAIRHLKAELAKLHPKTRVIKELMDKTFVRRREWITTELPIIEEVINVFPALCIERWVRPIYIAGIN